MQAFAEERGLGLKQGRSAEWTTARVPWSDRLANTGGQPPGRERAPERVLLRGLV